MKNVLILTALIVGVVHAQVPTDRAWTILTDGAADKNAEKREKAYHALGLLNGNAKARGLAEAGLADPNSTVRAAAADALGRMGATASIPKLKEVVTNDKEAEAVFAAANALYLLKDKTAYDVYYAVLTGERKSGQGLVESQMKMLKDPKALAQMGFEAGIGFVPFAGAGLHVLKMVTKDDVSPIRAAAALKLAGDPDPKSGEALAASDKKTLVRAAAVDAIAKRGDPKLLSAIFPLLDDSEDIVKFEAAATVLKLSGHGKAVPSK